MTTSIVNKNIDDLLPVIDMFRDAVRAKAFLFGESLVDEDIASRTGIERKCEAVLMEKGCSYWFPFVPESDSWANYFVNISYGRGILLARKYITRNKQLMEENSCCIESLSVNPTDIKSAASFSYHRDCIYYCYELASDILTTIASSLRDAAIGSDNTRKAVSRAYKCLVRDGLINEFLDVMYKTRILSLIREYSQIGDISKLMVVLVSVMDSKTRKECKDACGSIFSASTPIGTLHKHILCRCIPIPISIAESSTAK